MASRNILLEGVSPAPGLLLKLAFVSVLVLLLGLFVFRKLERGFYEYL
jgi:ABC-type polysaccharide/polyol phosphate export permease